MAYDDGGRETERVFTCGGASVTATREYGSWNGMPSRMTCGPIECQAHFDVLDRLTNLT